MSRDDVTGDWIDHRDIVACLHVGEDAARSLIVLGVAGFTADVDRANTRAGLRVDLRDGTTVLVRDEDRVLRCVVGDPIRVVAAGSARDDFEIAFVDRRHLIGACRRCEDPMQRGYGDHAVHAIHAGDGPMTTFVPMWIATTSPAPRYATNSKRLRASMLS